MDAGADLVITQLFYDVERFFQFEKDCRSVGINAPIIPGAPGEGPTPSGEYFALGLPLKDRLIQWRTMTG